MENNDNKNTSSPQNRRSRGSTLNNKPQGVAPGGKPKPKSPRNRKKFDTDIFYMVFRFNQKISLDDIDIDIDDFNDELSTMNATYHKITQQILDQFNQNYYNDQQHLLFTNSFEQLPKLYRLLQRINFCDMYEVTSQKIYSSLFTSRCLLEIVVSDNTTSVYGMYGCLLCNQSRFNNGNEPKYVSLHDVVDAVVRTENKFDQLDIKLDKINQLVDTVVYKLCQLEEKPENQEYRLSQLKKKLQSFEIEQDNLINNKEEEE